MEIRLVDTGGLRLAMAECGEGSPAVVLEGGLLAGREDWEPVAREVCRQTRVVLYDRAGRGESEPGPLPRSGLRLAAELHALLQAAAVPGPYLLAGHSLGGLIVRLFAWQYPEQTAGLVLVDPTHEQQFDAISALLPPPGPNDTPALERLRSFWSQRFRDPNQNEEKIDLSQTCVEARQVASLGALPLILLTAGEAWNDLGLQEKKIQELNRTMLGLHEQTVRSSSNSALVTVPGAGHFIQRDRPQVVAWAIARMLESIRTGQSLQALTEKS